MGEFLIFIFFVRATLFKKSKTHSSKYDEGVNNHIYKFVMLAFCLNYFCYFSECINFIKINRDNILLITFQTKMKTREVQNKRRISKLKGLQKWVLIRNIWLKTILNSCSTQRQLD